MSTPTNRDINAEWTGEEYDAFVNKAIDYILDRDPAEPEVPTTCGGTVAISNVGEVLDALGISQTNSMRNLLNLIHELILCDEVDVRCDLALEFEPSLRHLEQLKKEKRS